MADSTFPVSVLYPTMPGLSPALVPFAELVRDTPARRLWMGQSVAADTHQSLAYLAGRGVRVPVGTSVSLMPLRHPYDAAVQARSIAWLMGEPVVAGFGQGSPKFVEMLHGRPYARPATAAGEYAAVVRDLLTGEKIDRAGDYFPLRGGLTPMPAPPVEVGLGVLRPAMARTAGAVADAAITWMTPPNYLTDTLVPALAAGADKADRRAPRLITVVHVALARPGRDPRRLAYAAALGHLGMAHYTDMLRRAGVPVRADDPEAGAAALVEHGVYVTGSPDEVVDELDRYRKAGVDEIVLNAGGVFFTEGAEAALADLAEIVTAVAARHG